MSDRRRGIELPIDVDLDFDVRLDRYIDVDPARSPTAFMAIRNLSRSQLRSALACLGILIGVLAIASLGIFGNVLSLGASDALGDIGNQVILTPNADAGIQTIDESTLTEIRRAAGETTVVPLRTSGGLVEYAGGSTATTIYGIAEPGGVYTASEGRVPDRFRQGALVGASVAEDLSVRVGGTISVDGETYRVVGVLTEVESFSPLSPNDAVFLPEDAVGDGTGYDQVTLEADSGAAAAAAASEIDAAVNSREEVLDIFELASVTAEIDQFFSLLNSFLLGLGGISLVVAGVSILNVMLMSTVERREEIGVLRAVGVEKRDVMRMILVEAALLGVIGAAGGVLASIAIVGLLYLVAPIDLWILLAPSNAAYLVLAFVIGVAISVVSGLYPAWKAANERPVDALRS